MTTLAVKVALGEIAEAMDSIERKQERRDRADLRQLRYLEADFAAGLIEPGTYAADRLVELQMRYGTEHERAETMALAPRLTMRSLQNLTAKKLGHAWLMFWQGEGSRLHSHAMQEVLRLGRELSGFRTFYGC